MNSQRPTTIPLHLGLSVRLFCVLSADRAVSSAPESSLDCLNGAAGELSVEKGKWDVTRELLRDGAGEGAMEK